MSEPSGRMPIARATALRRLLFEELSSGSATALELSARLNIPEDEIVDLLAQLDRSLRRTGRRLVVHPAVCPDCGTIFRKQEHIVRPSECSSCHGAAVEPPKFRVR